MLLEKIHSHNKPDHPQDHLHNLTRPPTQPNSINLTTVPSIAFEHDNHSQKYYWASYKQNTRTQVETTSAKMNQTLSALIYLQEYLYLHNFRLK